MKKFFVCFITACLIMCTSCKGESSKVKQYSATEIMMTTVVTISIYDDDESALNGAIELCRHYENLFSRTIQTSDVSRLNSADGQPITINTDTAELIKIALDISKESNGAFDITVTPLTELWNVTEAITPPNPTDIDTALQKVGYKNVLLDGNTVTLLNGVTLDLGGIAKGYIADKVKAYLIEQGVTRGTINLGGNVVLIGDNDGKPYSVGIQKPFAATGEAVLTLSLSDKTAVTSGIYERYFEFEGKNYHHIIDTSTGYPAENDVASATIITERSSIADGLSTACLILGIDKGKALAHKYGAEVVFVLRDGSIVTSDGLNADNGTELPCISLK